MPADLLLFLLSNFLAPLPGKSCALSQLLLSYPGNQPYIIVTLKLSTSFFRLDNTALTQTPVCKYQWLAWRRVPTARVLLALLWSPSSIWSRCSNGSDDVACIFCIFNTDTITDIYLAHKYVPQGKVKLRAGGHQVPLHYGRPDPSTSATGLKAAVDALDRS